VWNGDTGGQDAERRIRSIIPDFKRGARIMDEPVLRVSCGSAFFFRWLTTNILGLAVPSTRPRSMSMFFFFAVAAPPTALAGIVAAANTVRPQRQAVRRIRSALPSLTPGAAVSELLSHHPYHVLELFLTTHVVLTGPPLTPSVTATAGLRLLTDRTSTFQGSIGTVVLRLQHSTVLLLLPCS
jgi:hypothetical protein